MSHMVHEVKSAKTSDLLDRNVDILPLKVEFDDFNVRLIDQQQVLDLTSSFRACAEAFKTLLYSIDR